MSIYIKGVNMPKNHNYITITIWPNGIASYALHDRGESLVDFKNVEAISVPPHGRLIDVDVLCKTLRSFAEEVFANWIENHIDIILPASEENE